MKGRKRLLFIVPSLVAGGAQKVLTILLRNLPATKFDITLCVLTDTGVFYDRVPDTVTKINLGISRVRFAAPAVYRLIRNNRPDLVFVFDVNHLNLIVGLASFFLPKRIKFVTREAVVLSFFLNNYPFSRLLMSLYRVCFRRFDRVVCQSEYMKDDILRHFNVPPAKVAVINNPIELNASDISAVTDVKARNGEVRMIAVGRIVYVKGYDLLVQALSRVRLKNFKMTILGEETPENPGYKEQVVRMVKELGMDDKIAFRGFEIDPNSYIRQSDLLIVASRTEAFSNVAIESNAMGVPVLAFDSPGGMSEIIVEGFNGWLVENGNVEKMAKAIDNFPNVMLDKEKIREFTVNKYAVEKVILTYEKIITDLLD